MTPERPRNGSKWLARQRQAITDWVWMAPDAEKQLWRRALRAFLRIVYIVFREFNNDLIILRSSALTFTVVLSMVPMLALGAAVLKGIGTDDKMRQATHLFIERLEAPPVFFEEESPPAGTTAPTKKSSEADFTGHLHTALDKVFDYVDKTDFTALGTAGIVALLITVLMMLDSIEGAMNSIWRAERSRPLSRKLVDYLALIILLPLSMNIAFAAEASLRSPAMHAVIKNLFPFGFVGPGLFKILPILLVIMTFTILYRFLPNTPVGFKPAIIGATAGGIGWSMTQSAYVHLQVGVARYNAIYGSFATLPLFLLWLYAAWIVFLTGAEIAFAVQVWRRYIPGKKFLSPAQRLALAFDIIQTAAEDHKNRRLTTVAGTAGLFRLPDSSVSEVLEELRQKGFLRRIKDKESGYVPAAPAGDIKAEEIVGAVLGGTEGATNGSLLAAEVMKAALSAVRAQKLLPDDPRPAGGAGQEPSEPDNKE